MLCSQGWRDGSCLNTLTTPRLGAWVVGGGWPAPAWGSCPPGPRGHTGCWGPLWAPPRGFLPGPARPPGLGKVRSPVAIRQACRAPCLLQVALRPPFLPLLLSEASWEPCHRKGWHPQGGGAPRSLTRLDTFDASVPGRASALPKPLPTASHTRRWSRGGRGWSPSPHPSLLPVCPPLITHPSCLLSGAPFSPGITTMKTGATHTPPHRGFSPAPGPVRTWGWGQCSLLAPGRTPPGRAPSAWVIPEPQVWASPRLQGPVLGSREAWPPSARSPWAGTFPASRRCPVL